MVPLIAESVTGPGLYFSDYRVNQDLSRGLRLFVDLPSGPT